MTCNRLMRLAMIPCLLIPVGLVGCGKAGAGRGAIHGVVKLDGQPLEKGSILFSPLNGVKGTATGVSIAEGRYSLSKEIGPAVGTNRVEIRALRKTGNMIQKPKGRQGELVEEYAEAVPERFNSASTLTVDVQVGDNMVDFDVLSE